MSELIVIGYKDTHRAQKVLNELRMLDEAWAVDLDEAVAVAKKKNGQLKVQQSYSLTEEGARWGGLWGSLIGLILAGPLTAGASAAADAATLAAGAAAGAITGAAAGALNVSFWQEEVGLSNDFVESVSSMIQPGDSAIFALLRAHDPEFVIRNLKPFGGTLLRTSLSFEQDAKIQAILDVSGKK